MEELGKWRGVGPTLLFWTVLGVSGLYIFAKTVLFLSDQLAFQLGRTLEMAGLVVLTLLLIIGIVLRPVIGLYLLIFAFPLTNLSIETPILTISPPNLLLILIAVVMTARALLMRPGTRQENPLPWRELLLFGWILAATLVSIILAPNSEATGRFLITRVGYALTFLITVALVSDVGKLKVAFRMLVLSACVCAAVATFGAFFHGLLPEQLVWCNQAVLPVLNTPRCAAFSMSMHPYGSWLLLAFAPASFSIVRPDLFGIRKQYAVAAVLLLILGLIIGQVRGAWVSLLITTVIGVIAVGVPKKREGLALPSYFVAVSLATTILGFFLWIEVLRPIVAWRLDNVSIRIEEYKLAFQVFGQHALFGVGPLDDRFLALSPLGLGAVDNSFLVELAATGILGFIPFILLWGGAFSSSLRILRRPRKPELGTPATVILVTLLLELISVQAYIGIGEKGPWLAMGMAAGLVAMDRKTNESK
jgi:hypothetical protein